MPGLYFNLDSGELLPAYFTPTHHSLSGSGLNAINEFKLKLYLILESGKLFVLNVQHGKGNYKKFVAVIALHMVGELPVEIFKTL